MTDWLLIMDEENGPCRRRRGQAVALLEVVAACFARSGYDGTSMNDVAAAAKVSKGSVYDYFKSKEDLFDGVFAWLQQQLMQSLLAEMGTSASAQERIVRSVDAAVAGLIQHISLYPVSLEVWAAAARTQNARSLRRMPCGRPIRTTAGKSSSSSGRRRAPASSKRTSMRRSSAMVLVGAVDGLMLQYWLDPSIDPHRVVRNFFTALFEGIGQP